MKTFVFTGPESTGKSWLSGLLAGHYHTTWLPEYLREYYNQNNGITKEGMAIVAQRQVEQEKELMQLDYPFVFFDTNIITLKIYHQYYYNESPAWFADLYDENLYSHYFLLNTDVPWVNDVQRDSPEAREELFHCFKQVLEELQLPYTLISGNYSERLEQAKQIIDQQTANS